MERVVAVLSMYCMVVDNNKEVIL